ncbi:MAG: butyrate kinase [Candidatus Wallbacteria bacterium HGW-Wallbacteria-1]|jgi:butyrate kinase|uniref:Probable butyrate kinase n=1 Tax=Candidatus Wallbacteria bacterium HGW-Wallbacteria-1 TaxID=2013854 RepID=A0A2N1PR87_9BACT|nr:MAG: butyrate kinase [Candidatus Wallbacteria bacterium HGW-Wallbacteria-1]
MNPSVNSNKSCNEKILVINPGSGSTKIALYDSENELLTLSVKHPTEEISAFDSIIAQREFRRKCIHEALVEKGFNPADVAVVVGRGGPIRPLKSGTYEVDDVMVNELTVNFAAEHASLLGGLLARDFADQAGVKAYITDPVCVDEMIPLARLSGYPGIQRKSLAHALNIKAVARRTQKQVGKPYSESRLVIAHLGSGISITAHDCGHMTDVSNANSGGPYSPERSGGLPICELLEWVEAKGLSARDAKKVFTKKGGLFAYTGTIHANEVEDKLLAGDQDSKLFYDGMIYQIAKEIGAMAASLRGNLDAVIITGGLAFADYMVNSLRDYVSFLGKYIVFPGEDEMGALRDAGLRVLRNEELPESIGDK